MERRYNPAIIHQVLSEMAWERMRKYTHEMTADQLLATHLYVMSEILHNQKEHEEFWRRARERSETTPAPFTALREALEEADPHVQASFVSANQPEEKPAASLALLNLMPGTRCDLSESFKRKTFVQPDERRELEAHLRRARIPDIAR